MPLSMRSAKGASIALENPDAFKWQPLIDEKSDAKRATATFEKLNQVVTGNLADPQVARLDFLSRVAMNAEVSSDKIHNITKRHRAAGSYPATGLGNQLKIVAQMINGGLNTRIYYCSFGGFDTHANEPGTHERLLTELADAVSAFQRDMEARDQAGRVLTMTFSEFGRRVAQNASNGTDHGTAAPLFVFGSRVKPGLYGQHPSLTDLDRGDLKYSTDFRAVYATVLENWLGAKSLPILGRQFELLKFV
jgi:uncharacterized protein (DUF1501 family)